MDIRHRFESSVPDGPDVQEVRPSNWNDTHAFNIDGPAVVGAANLSITQAQAIVPSAPNQVLFYDGTNVIWSLITGAMLTPPIHMTGNPGPLLWLTENTDNANVEVLRIEGARATPTAADRAYISFNMHNASGSMAEVARILTEINVITAGSEQGRLLFAVKNAGTMANELILTAAAFAPFTNDGNALGATTNQWSDLFVASGAVLNFANGNLTVTHSTGVLALTSAISATVAPWRVTNTTDNADMEILRLDSDRATITANDQARMGLYVSSSTGVQTEIARIAWKATTVTNGAMVGQFDFHVINTTLSARMSLVNAALQPFSNDLISLGTGTVSWSDVFLATGGIISFNNGNYTLIHAAGQLTANGTLIIQTASLPINLINTTDSASNETARFRSARATPTANDEAFQGWYLANSVGTGVEMGRTRLIASNVTNGAETANFRWSVINAGALTAAMFMNSGSLAPVTTGAMSLGATTNMWQSLFLNAAGTINFNNGNVIGTHSTDQLTISAAANTSTSTFRVITTADTGSASVLRLEGDRATPTVADQLLVRMFMSDSAGNQDEMARQVVTIENVTHPTEDARIEWMVRSGGAITGVLQVNKAYLGPQSSGVLTLGDASHMWGNAFFNTGAKLDFNAGDVTVTHAANTLTFAGATVGYLFQDGPIGPVANDGIALGTATVSFADLFLATGAVINFANGNANITHSTGQLSFGTNTEAIRINSSQQVILGNAAAQTTFSGTTVTPQFQVLGTTSGTAAFSAARFSADASGARLYLAKSRGASIGTQTVVSAADEIGGIIFQGSDGTDFESVAAITAASGATPGNNDMPGRLHFWVTPDGSATLSERMRIENDGSMRLIGGNFGRESPVTKTGNFTLAATENWLIINQAATTTVTLPAASGFPGREVMFKTIQAQTLVSASSNVVPRAGGAAGTAILAATAGNWATIVSDGTNWILMQGTP